MDKECTLSQSPDPERSEEEGAAKGRMTSKSVEPRWNELGLMPAVVQDAQSGEVLMLAWMNAEAWRLTRETGEAHFWSRARQALWRKGETSGNVQRIVEIRLDCDQDAALLRVEPAGPACHTGARSCFYTTVLHSLYQVILDRQQHPRPGSYTARLLEQGLVEIAKKVGEECVEVIIAALNQSEERLMSEIADMMYHILVLLAARGVPLSSVERELERRQK